MHIEPDAVTDAHNLVISELQQSLRHRRHHAESHHHPHHHAADHPVMETDVKTADAGSNPPPEPSNAQEESSATLPSIVLTDLSTPGNPSN